MTPVRTLTLEGFCDSLELILRHARAGHLVAVSINLDPTGLGHYSYKLLDGAVIPPDIDPDLVTAEETKPGKKRPPP